MVNCERWTKRKVTSGIQAEAHLYMFYHLLFVSATAGLPGPPVPDPARPKPYWSWDRIPLAFHGANRTGEFNELEIQILADNYQLVTIEKWYTACGSKHPIQNGPWCDVEKPMYSAFNKIKAKNPNVTTIMYVISIFYAHFNEKRTYCGVRRMGHVLHLCPLRVLP